MNEIRFKKLRDVKSPVRGHSLDAGIDFFIPTDLGWMYRVSINPGGHIRIPSGIAIEIPEGWCMTFVNKSGISYDKQLIVGAQLIDAGYQGEVHFHLINTGTFNTHIGMGDKICQGIFLPVPKFELIEHDEIFTTTTTRGRSGFGSTNQGEHK